MKKMIYLTPALCLRFWLRRVMSRGVSDEAR